ncbi:hypothetical protein H5410_043994 [Solanum commersonii]|uniref:Uncharacterized protein n=1 Tax=Solanum commersonii TaxID=4109 RepID=A0A9J5Y1S2_SOLCO|nr:hypothetical protein H5410_043994 [Solanum commersonii]
MAKICLNVNLRANDEVHVTKLVLMQITRTIHRTFQSQGIVHHHILILDIEHGIRALSITTMIVVAIIHAQSVLFSKELAQSWQLISQTTSDGQAELHAMFTTRNSPTQALKHKSPNIPSYDPNAFCDYDYCNRTGHTRAICFQLYGYSPGPKSRKKGPAYGRAKNNNERRQF